MGALSHQPNMLRGLLLIATLCIASACTKQDVGESVSSEVRVASDYVFAACLIQNYSSTPLAAEAEVWAQGLVEAGNLPGDAYASLAALTQLAPEIRQSSNGTSLKMESCTKLYHDPRVLDRLRQIAQIQPRG